MKLKVFQASQAKILQRIAKLRLQETDKATSCHGTCVTTGALEFQSVNAVTVEAALLILNANAALLDPKYCFG